MKKLFIVVFVFFSCRLEAQLKSVSDRLQCLPENPQAGKEITIIYDPGTEPNENDLLAAEYFLMDAKGIYNADDLLLKKKGRCYTGSIHTDTATSFLFFRFHHKQVNINDSLGYYLLMSEGNKPKRSSWSNLSLFYQHIGQRVGIKKDKKRALDALKMELSLYPEDSNRYAYRYAALLYAVAKDKAASFISQKIRTLRSDTRTEDDFEQLRNLLKLAGDEDQAKKVKMEMKDKFPNGKWKMYEMASSIQFESDVKKKKISITQFFDLARSSSWDLDSATADAVRLSPLMFFLNRKDWDGLKQAIKDQPLKKEELASIQYKAAYAMQSNDTLLQDAMILAQAATSYAKSQWKNPTEPKPNDMTTRDWKEKIKMRYAGFATSYAMILYKNKQYLKGIMYADEAALKILEGKSEAANFVYASIAEKALPLTKATENIERFVKDGCASDETKQILKRLYKKRIGTAKGFDNYLSSLQSNNNQHMLKELRKMQLNKPAPSFGLLDLLGNRVNSSDLLGKVVIIDFWATWCKPCKAAFPAMQKLVNSYHNDSNVVFLFIDTWETGSNTERNVADYMQQNKYPFHVLFDKDSKLIEQFKASGVPAKYVIDKNGILRFASIGFPGEDKLTTEINLMIKLASQS